MRNKSAWVVCALVVGVCTAISSGQTRKSAATQSTVTKTAVTKPAHPNLVHNPSFESGTEGWGFNLNDARGGADLDSSEKHSGTKSYRMSFQSKFAPNVYERFAQGVGGLKPNTAYRISTFSKGKGVGIAWIGGGPGWFFRT